MLTAQEDARRRSALLPSGKRSVWSSGERPLWLQPPAEPAHAVAIGQPRRAADRDSPPTAPGPAPTKAAPKGTAVATPPPATPAPAKAVPPGPALARPKAAGSGSAISPWANQLIVVKQVKPAPHSPEQWYVDVSVGPFLLGSAKVWRRETGEYLMFSAGKKDAAGQWFTHWAIGDAELRRRVLEAAVISIQRAAVEALPREAL